MNIGFIYKRMASTTFVQKSTSLAVETLLCKASKVHHRPIHHFRFNSKVKYNRFSVPELNLGLSFQKDATRKMNMAVYSSVPQGNSPPIDSFPVYVSLFLLVEPCFVINIYDFNLCQLPLPPFGRKVWIIGTIITILLSFTKSKWGPLLQWKEKIEITIEEAERVADIVEEVAEGVEKVAEEAVKHLPKGKLHDAAELVEKVAADIDKHAQNAEDVLEKVEDMEKEVDSFFESTTRQEKSIAATTESKDKK
ncbi:hypothetical protein CR513_43815, partial [Mucuna pruriens]